MKVNMGLEKICQRHLQYYNFLKILPLLLMIVNPLLFIDLKNAFDTVDHDIIIKNLITMV